MPTSVGGIQSCPNYSKANGDETYVPPPEAPPAWQPPIDVMESGPPDGGVRDAGGDGPVPDAGWPTSPDATPRVPQQVGFSFGVDVSVTVIHPGLSNGGGTIGVTAGVSTYGGEGAVFSGYQSPPDGTSNGFSVGLTLGVSGSVGWPTSAPTDVVGGSLGPVGASLSHTPGEGGPGNIGAGIGLALGPPGLYSTQTTSKPLYGGADERSDLDGGQCIEGDLDGDGRLSEDEARLLQDADSSY